MQLDFTNGSIYAPSFTFKTKLTENNTTIDNTLFQFNLYNSESKFLITSKYNGEDVDIFKATGIDVNSEHKSKETYYLQSVNYTLDSKTEATTGLKIDLVDGSLKSPKFKIDSGGNATFTGNMTAGSISADTKLNVANGAFIVDEDGVYVSGEINSTLGKIGGWNIGPTFLSSGSITKTSSKDKDGKDITVYTGTGTILNSNGNIVISGTLESTGGDINLNGVKITAADGDAPGALQFTSDNITSTLSLKAKKIIGFDANGNPQYAEYHTPGAVTLDAPVGISIDT